MDLFIQNEEINIDEAPLCAHFNLEVKTFNSARANNIFSKKSNKTIYQFPFQSKADKIKCQ